MIGIIGIAQHIHKPARSVTRQKKRICGGCKLASQINEHNVFIHVRWWWDMFNPNDWTRKIRDINGQVRITYKNVDTELEKVRETFSHEQQEALKAHEVKIYSRGELE